jgi:hypothetical protein
LKTIASQRRAPRRGGVQAWKYRWPLRRKLISSDQKWPVRKKSPETWKLSAPRRAGGAPMTHNGRRRLMTSTDNSQI